jgi:hypothetical protein
MSGKVVFMKNNSFGTTLAAVICVIGVLAFIVWIEDASTPKCIETGCDNDRASGSSYCYLHKPSYGSSLKKSSNTSHKGNTSSQSRNSSTQSSTSSKKSTGTKNSTSSRKHNSYDEGYEAIYDDDDYDLDRYYDDSDYANGVDDAMDDLDW